jgi:hypothetical protein
MDIVDVHGDWTPVLIFVLEQIKLRFAKEDSEEEQKGHVARSYK